MDSFYRRILSLDLKRGSEARILSSNGTKFKSQGAEQLNALFPQAEGTVGWRQEKT